MFLTLFSQLTYLNILHWREGLYYLGFLVHEGICLILVIQLLYVYIEDYIKYCKNRRRRSLLAQI